MPAKNADATWMKNHPLEGDNIVTGFYNFLAKKNPKTMKPCRDILVPDTIVFEHNFPRGWYTTDIKAREVMRKQGKELDAATIEKGFTENVSDACPVVATYLCIQEDDLGNGETETKTLVEVKNKDTIAEFLARKTKREGILQKFVQPKGYHNSAIKVVWSPRVCIVQRRTNKYPIFDRKRAEGDPFSSVVTYEGPNFLSEEGTVSGNIAEEAKRLCGHIVQHFYYTEHKFITRMVLYFKADKKDRLWFLWCGSLRVADRGSYSEMPVNLTTNFAEPSGGPNSFNEDRLLWEADQAYLRVTNDEMFFEMYMKNVKLETISGLEGGDTDGRSGGANSASKTNAAGGMRAGGIGAGEEADDGGAHFDWSSTPPLAQETHERLARERLEISALFEDLFYKARSHNCTSPRAPSYVLEVPPRARTVLTENGIVDLMRRLRLPPVPVSGRTADSYEDDSTRQDSDSGSLMCYSVDVASLKTPVTKLNDEAKEWIDAFFDAKENRLRAAVEHLIDDSDALHEAIRAL